ncbi:MAG: hypothetical protein R3C42_02475 [Parvularculaceae bacterium]
MARRIFAVLAALALPGCVEATIAWTNLKPDGPVAAPALSYQGVEDWEANGAPQARAQLQRHVYGFMPDRASSRVIGKITLNEDAFGGAGLVEEYRIGATMTYGGREVETVSRDGADGFFMDVVSPKGEGPFPVILMETFCPRWSTIPDRGVAGAPEPEKRGGFRSGTYIFRTLYLYAADREITARAMRSRFSRAIHSRREEGRRDLRALARLTRLQR